MTGPDHAILIVDDDEDIRELLAELLREEGYRVVTAENGRAALARLRSAEAAPCLILLDLMMPVMNGFEFLEAFRSDPALASIPVAVVTAHGGLRDEERAALAVPILAKPVPLPVLLEVVGRLC